MGCSSRSSQCRREGTHSKPDSQSLLGLYIADDHGPKDLVTIGYATEESLRKLREEEISDAVHEDFLVDSLTEAVRCPLYEN